MPYLLHHANGSVHIMRLASPQIDIEGEITKYRAAYPDFNLVQVTEISEDQIPTDRTFREAWRHCPENGVRHCMATARNIHRDRMREKRKLLFSEVDAAFTRALMKGLDVTQIAAEAQKLRDVPASEEVEQAQSIEELKELWPLEVLGETPYRAPVTPEPQPMPEPPVYVPPTPEEPEAAPIEEQTDLEDFLAAPEPPLELPRMYQSRPVDGGSILDAMRRVEELEAADAPLPDYVPPPEPPTAADIFRQPDVTDLYKQRGQPREQLQPIRQRLREAVTKARNSLTEDNWEYDIAVMAGHGNKEQEAKLDNSARRRGVSVQTVADEIIANWRGCERAMAYVRDINEQALDDMVANPGDGQGIVDKAIALIEEQVGNATAYRT